MLNLNMLWLVFHCNLRQNVIHQYLDSLLYPCISVPVFALLFRINEYVRLYT